MTDERQITITLPPADFEALEYVARTQCRTAEQQAAYFIKRLLAMSEIELPTIEAQKAAILARLEKHRQEAPAP